MGEQGVLIDMNFAVKHRRAKEPARHSTSARASATWPR
jgi:hypothetical protein